MNVYRRKRRGPDGSFVESDEYYVRLRWQGRQILRNTGYTTAADARRFGAALKKALAEGRLEDVAGSALRRDPGIVTLGQVVAAFEAAPGDWTPHTRRGYVGGLRTVVETALGTSPAWDSRPVTVLDGELVYRYKQAISGVQADDARRTQLQRSANTLLRSARALFSPHLLEHYRIVAGLRLPDLSEFRQAPGFRGVAKEDYRIPSDDLVRATLADLEASRFTHPDRYAAVWLALGFGLRKSEAAAVRAGWFVRLNGRIHLELREVVQPGTPGQTSTATKSGAINPRIPVANGAWEHLVTIVELLPPDRHVLAPAGTDTYRADALFDEISGWLRGLGWETQKAFHEFRALAGCWVAMRDGLLVARDWLRHSSVTTTERHYGRYVRTCVTDAPATVLATAPSSNQTTPNSAALAHVAAVQAGQTAIHVIDFPRVGDATPSGTTEMRP